MKFEGKVLLGKWTGMRPSMKIELTLSNESSSTTFNNVSMNELSKLIEELEKIKEELENSPMKNAWA